MKPNECLKMIFGHDKFRHQQKQIIDEALTKKDLLVLMPTGGGKSLCYQLPGYLNFKNKGEVTIVISPLRSLIFDQISHLKELNIPYAKFY